MLDLEPSIDFQEIEVAVLIQQELDGSGIGVTGGLRHCDGRLGQPCPKRGTDNRGRRLLDHFLVAALNRTLAFDERTHVAVMVGEDLNLDVTGAQQATLEIERRVAECGGGFRAREPDGARESIGARHDAHPFAAASGNGFHEQGIPDSIRCHGDVSIAGLRPERLLRPGHDGNAG